MDLGEFLKFCQDFKINQDMGFSNIQIKQMYTTAFVLGAQNKKEILFDDFLIALQILFKIDDPNQLINGNGTE
mgnify:CR=1 FL=1